MSDELKKKIVNLLQVIENEGSHYESVCYSCLFDDGKLLSIKKVQWED